MNIYKIVSLICGIAGVGVLLFAAAVKLNMIPQVDPSKSTILIILGLIIVVWALISARRRP